MLHVSENERREKQRKARKRHFELNKGSEGTSKDTIT